MTATRAGRSPYKVRADGKRKDLTVVRDIVSACAFAAVDPQGGVGFPPSMQSGDRTRSGRWRAGTRRAKKHARARDARSRAISNENGKYLSGWII